MTSYDKMEWHYGRKFPRNLPTENGGTHIGMFLTWIIENDLIGSFHRESSQEFIQSILNRKATGRDFLIEMCDETFWEEDLNEEGNEFTKYYYEKKYFEDYYNTLGSEVEIVYAVKNSWDNYDKLKAVIDERYKEWKLQVKA